MQYSLVIKLRGDQVYLVPSNWLPFFPLGTVGSSPDLLAEFKGRRKEELGREWVKQGGTTTGDGEGTAEEKGGSAPTPRQVLCNFSAVVAPV